MNINVFKLSEFKVQQDQSLPQGTFGIVWDAWHERHNRVAVKVMRYAVTFEDFKKEVEVMLKASEEFCGVPTYGMICQNISNNLPCYAIVSKFMPCGTLNDLIHMHKIHLPRCLSYRMLHDISDAMKKLHTIYPDQRLLHCDLKPSNILLDENLQAKLSDFGASRLSTYTQNRRLEGPDPSPVYTISYCAPEFFDRLARSSKSDVFSFATMVWEVLTTRIPFEGLSVNEIRAFTSTNHRMDMTGIENQQMQDLITMGRSKEPDDRPPFSEIKEVLNALRLATSDAEMDEAVYRAKHNLLEKQDRLLLETSSAEYQINLADALRNNNLIGAVPIPDEAQDPQHLVGSPIGDEASVGGHQRLTDEHCVKLGSNLHYTDGWEVLAHRLGLTPQVVENIKGDNRKSAQCKIAMFREWKTANGGARASVREMAKSLKQQKVAVDVWEFLMPNRQERLSL